ncbi:MAG: AsmA family protein [Wenzhouxiangella sp.]|jgi:hypothetical protein|nr:AsmA family protein [Wenzhouxiangella sp.]
MRSKLVIGAALLIMVMGLVGSAVILFDEQRLKLLVTRHVENHTGQRIEIQGTLRVRLFPGLRLSAERVLIRGPGNRQLAEPLTISQLDMQVRLLPLIRGNIRASNVRVQGAHIRLHSDEANPSPLDRLLAGLAGDGQEDEPWARGPVAFEDVRITLTDSDRMNRESLAIESMELEGMALGGPMELRFRGNIGDAGLFDWVSVDGLLVPGETRHRLNDLFFEAELDQGRYNVQLTGDLSFSPSAPINLALAGGELRINEHEANVDLTYRGYERPYLAATVQAAFLDADVLMLTDMIAGLSGMDDDAPLMIALRGMDLDVSVAVDQLAQLGMVLKGLAVEARARDGLVSVNSVQADLPGGTAMGRATLDLTRPGAPLEASVRADISHLASLMAAMRMDWVVDGAGLAGLDLVARPAAAVDGAVPWSGTGSIELWDGQWPLLEWIVAEPEAGVATEPFDFLGATLELTPDRVILSNLQATRGSLAIEGELALGLAGGSLSGRLELLDPQRARVVDLGGTLSEPALSQLQSVPPEL